MTLDRDYEICGAASAGPWGAEPRNDVPPIEALAEALDGKDFELWKLTAPDGRASVALLIEGEPDATYIAHFDPVRVRKLLDRVQVLTQIETRCIDVLVNEEDPLLVSFANELRKLCDATPEPERKLK